MDPPVVEHLRQMSRTAGLFDEPEEEVVVLTAVALGAFAAQLLIQRPLEDCQMTDVVAAEQIIRGIIGLEMSHHRLFDVLGEERLVTVEETIRLTLFAELQDSLTHRVHGVGASTSSWSARARYSPVASVSAALVLAAMPLFSTFLYTIR